MSVFCGCVCGVLSRPALTGILFCVAHTYSSAIRSLCVGPSASSFVCARFFFLHTDPHHSIVESSISSLCAAVTLPMRLGNRKSQPYILLIDMRPYPYLSQIQALRCFVFARCGLGQGQPSVDVSFARAPLPLRRHHLPACSLSEHR